MKTMTCRQLAGACDLEFHADSFDEISEKSKMHAMEMMKCGDKAHMDKMQEMMELMKNPKALGEWFEGKKKEFYSLAEDT